MVVKFLQEHLESLGFTSRLANHEIRKGDEKQRTSSQKNMAKRVRVTRRGGKDAPEEKWDRKGRQAADHGANSRSIKAFQFGNVGKAKKRKPPG